MNKYLISGVLFITSLTAFSATKNNITELFAEQTSLATKIQQTIKQQGNANLEHYSSQLSINNLSTEEFKSYKSKSDIARNLTNSMLIDATNMQYASEDKMNKLSTKLNSLLEKYSPLSAKLSILMGVYKQYLSIGNNYQNSMSILHKKTVVTAKKWSNFFSKIMGINIPSSNNMMEQNKSLQKTYGIMANINSHKVYKFMHNLSSDPKFLAQYQNLFKENYNNNNIKYVNLSTYIANTSDLFTKTYFKKS